MYLWLLPLLYDAGLIFIESKFTFSPNIQPVCLPQSILENTESLAHQSVTVVGWGRGNRNQHSGGIVQIDIAILPDNVCDQMYENAGDFKSRIRVEKELPNLIEPNQF